MRPHQRREEQGVALIWAIIVMIIVIGLIVVMVASTLNSTRETRDSASRTRAVFWAEAASKDLVARIDNAELGPWVASRTAAGNQYLSFAVPNAPVGMTTPANGAFPVAGTGTRAIPLTSTAGGTTQRGYYQVLPPVTGAPAWTGVKIMDPAQPGEQGAIQFVVRAWTDAIGTRPVLVRVELRRNALSRFSMLSEDQLTLGGIGTLQLGGSIHSNNTRNAATAIQVGGATDLSGVRSISSTTGSIAGCAGAICKPAVREVVSFGSAARAMRHVEQLSALGRCVPARFAACAISGLQRPPLDQIPVWHVNLAGPGGCLVVGRMTGPTRTDTGVYPMLDDRRGPTGGPVGTSSYCPAPGGGAMVLDGDVIIAGMRPAGAAPVTIMARRTTAFPTAQVNGATAPTAVTAPASIYFQQTGSGAGIGAATPDNPVGLVAQGGIYLPSWAMTGVNDVLVVRNVAAMAVSGEVAYSPSIQSIAADGSTPGGLGLLPAAARALNYGYGTRFQFEGSLISGGRMVFRYGQAASWLGYGQRDISYVDSLSWNPPPWFPADSDWHVADWTEFDA